MTTPSPSLIALFGPTGSGKSDLAEAIADRTGALLINADAFQVYRGLDIGTNKSSRKAEYALIDIKDAQDSYGVGEFVVDACDVLAKAYAEGRDAIVVGGTGLYIRALFEEYREMAAAPDADLRAELQQVPLDELLARLDGLAPGADVDRANRIRVQRALERAMSNAKPLEFAVPPFARIKIGLEVDREALVAGLDARVHHLLEQGWIEEVRGLLAAGVLQDSAAFRAIGYSEISRHLGENLFFEELVETIQIRTRQYAKRQSAWMRSEPRLLPLTRERLGAPTSAEIAKTLQIIKEASNQG